MNINNFNGKGGGQFHHLTPYQKKYRPRNIVVKKEDVVWHYAEKQEELHCDTNEIIDKITNEVVVLNNPDTYKHKRGFMMYHSHQSFKVNNSEMAVSDSIGGCGMQQIYGWTNIYEFEEAVKLLEFYIANRHGGVGIVICQLGQSYYDYVFEEALIQTGFKVMSEYKNYQHCPDGKYKQKIYSLKF